MSRSPRTLRCLLHCQHLTGSGHFVRSYEIGCALARAHEVHLLDGGRPVPRPASEPAPELLSVPRIHRTAEGLAPLGGDVDLSRLMAQRSTMLSEHVDALRPDVLVIEHYPLSKWELEPEILPLIERVHDRREGVRVVCSLGAIAPATRHERVSEIRGRAIYALTNHFDAVLVHADPRFVHAEENAPWLAESPVPVLHTGFVSQKPGSAGPSGAAGAVIVSAGGAGGKELRDCALEAWRLLRSDGATHDRAMVVFLELGEELDTESPSEEDVRVVPFSPDFIDWVDAADLSISQAGYNTCTNLLETRTRAILVPDAAMPDQALRAQRMEERGQAIKLAPQDLQPDTLATLIAKQLAAPPPSHDYNLEGAEISCQLIEELCEG